MKEKATLLVHWNHVARARLVAKDEDKGSALKREWRMFSNYIEESVEWVSEHLCKNTGCKLPKLAPKVGCSRDITPQTEIAKPTNTNYAGHVELNSNTKEPKQNT